MTGPREWDKELAAVDKAIQRMKEPTGSPAPSGSTPVRQASAGGPPAVSRRGVLATWLRVGLVLALAAAVPFWPYPHACSIDLFAYLGVVILVVIGGAWGAISSWDRRLGLAHVLSCLTIVWGLALLAVEVLPRIGYAAKTLAWTCS